MFERIELMSIARAMTDHAAKRQTVVARNVANADTPGYAARDLEPFEDSYRNQHAPELRRTRTGHIDATVWTADERREFSVDGPASPNGNNVSLEEEMLRAAETKKQHELSLGIYRSALDLMRTSLGRS